MQTRKALSILTSLVLCILGSILVGFTIYGGRIFEPGLIYNQFVFSALVCAAYLVSMRLNKPRYAMVTGAVAFVAMLVFGGSHTRPLLLRDAVWLMALFAAVRVCLWNDGLFPRLALGKFVLWGATFGVIHLAMFTLLTFLNGRPFDMGLAEVAIRIGTLVGAGLGLGDELAGLISARFWGKDIVPDHGEEYPPVKPIP